MMDPNKETFHAGSESTCELIIERTSSTTFTFAIVHYLGMVSFGPEAFPLGRFLSDLGLTAEDCAAALESVSKSETLATNLHGQNRIQSQGLKSAQWVKT